MNPYDKIMLALPSSNRKPVNSTKKIGMYNGMPSKRLGVYNSQSRKRLGIYN